MLSTLIIMNWTFMHGALMGMKKTRFLLTRIKFQSVKSPKTSMRVFTF